MKSLLLSFVASAGLALSAAGLEFKVETDHPDAVYACGERVVFTVSALADDGKLATTGTYRVVIDNFGPETNGWAEVDVARKNPFVICGYPSGPGFLRLRVIGEVKNPTSFSSEFVWGAAVSPEKIVQKRACPDDFDAFWAAGAARLEKEVPLDPRLEKDEARSAKDGAFDWYQVSFATFGRRVYGWLSVPKGVIGSGRKVPGRVQVPGAGFGSWSQEGMSRAGAASLRMTVFPFAPSFDVEANRPLFEAFEKGLWGSAPREPYYVHGICGAREDCYYHDVLLGINRAVDWFAAQDFVDASDFTYNGTSQGGGFGLMLLGLNRRFTRGCIYVPALTGHFAHLDGRQDGWPGFRTRKLDADEAAIDRNAPYYDGVNFAQRITVPVRFAVGFSDVVCAPHAVYSAYNVCTSPDKDIVNCPGMGHGVYGWVYERLDKWEEGK